MDPVWEQLFQARNWGRYPPDALVRMVLGAFPLREVREQTDALDLGAGPGAITWFLAREGFRTSACDGAPTGLERNTTRLRQEGLAADLRIADFTQRLPWGDHTFDLVIDGTALYANPWDGMCRAVREVHRVLRPGGRFLSILFSDATTGAPPAASPPRWEIPPTGPLAGTGRQTFCRAEDLPPLLTPFSRTMIDRHTSTRDGGTTIIDQWLIQAIKDPEHVAVAPGSPGRVG